MHAARIGDERLRELIGEAKHRAHLNYVYGVIVEEALQYAVELEVSKERATVEHPGPALRRALSWTRCTSASTAGRAPSCSREFRDESSAPAHRAHLADASCASSCTGCSSTA